MFIARALCENFPLCPPCGSCKLQFGLHQGWCLNYHGAEVGIGRSRL